MNLLQLYLSLFMVFHGLRSTFAKEEYVVEFYEEIRMDGPFSSMHTIPDRRQFLGTCYAYAFGDFLDTLLKRTSSFYPKMSRIILAIDNNILFQQQFDKKRFYYWHLKDLFQFEFPLNGGNMWNNTIVMNTIGYYPHHLIEGRLNILFEKKYLHLSSTFERLEALFEDLRVYYIRMDINAIQELLSLWKLEKEKIYSAVSKSSFLLFLKEILTEKEQYRIISDNILQWKAAPINQSKIPYYHQEVLKKITSKSSMPIPIDYCFKVFLKGSAPNNLLDKEECGFHVSTIIGKRLIRNVYNKLEWQVLIKDSNKIDYTLHPNFQAVGQYKIWISLETLLKSSCTYYYHDGNL